MFYVLLLTLFLKFCLFVRSFFGCFFNRFLSFLSFFFHLFCDNLPCSGMFRNVPECSMFLVLLTPFMTCRLLALDSDFSELLSQGEPRYFLPFSYEIKRRTKRSPSVST